MFLFCDHDQPRVTTTNDWNKHFVVEILFGKKKNSFYRSKCVCNWVKHGGGVVFDTEKNSSVFVWINISLLLSESEFEMWNLLLLKSLLKSHCCFSNICFSPKSVSLSLVVIVSELMRLGVKSPERNFKWTEEWYCCCLHTSDYSKYLKIWMKKKRKLMLASG